MGSTLAIITARGGSKRIPRKNIREFCGKPIIAYSIEAALKSAIFDEVMVSTDDEEIAEISKKYGASVPFMRSEETANDYATTADVIKEVLKNYKNFGKEFERFCCIYPTAPFVTVEKLQNAMNVLEEIENVDSVITITPFSFPTMRGMYVRNGNVEYAFPEYAQKRSQDIEEMYHDCGQFYCLKTEVFLKTERLVTEHTKGMIVSELEVQDIDNETDWKLAEIKYQMMKVKKQ